MSSETRLQAIPPRTSGRRSPLLRPSSAPRARSSGPRTSSCSPRPPRPVCSTRATPSSRRSSRSSPSVSPRAAPTSSTTPPTPTPTASTPRSASVRSPPASSRRPRRAASPSASSSSRRAITAPINDGKLTAVVAALRRGHALVHDLAQARAGDRPRRGRRRVRVPGHRRRCRHRRAAVRLVPDRGRRGSLFIVTGKRHAEQVELGSDSHESPQHARRVLHRVPRLRPRGRVRSDDHRVLPLGVRERGQDRRHRRGSGCRSSRS